MDPGGTCDGRGAEDFEWTCDGGDGERQVHSDDVEIIEFSYVIYDAQVRLPV